MEIFHLFPYLPIELRNLIWTFSLPGPRRIVPLTTYRTLEDIPPKKTSISKKDLVALRVNRESRSIALRHYSNWHHAASFGYQYVDFSIDTIYFEAASFNLATPSITLLKLTKADFGRITTLDLGFRSLENVGKRLSRLISNWVLNIFTCVSEINALVVTYTTRSLPFDMDMEERLKKIVNEAKVMGDESLELIAARKAEAGIFWVVPSLNVRTLEE